MTKAIGMMIVGRNLSIYLVIKKDDIAISSLCLYDVLSMIDSTLPHFIIFDPKYGLRISFSRIIQFDHSANENSESSVLETYNKIELSKEFLDRLTNVNLVRVEILNPFGSLNETKVRDQDLKVGESERIRRIAKCFSDKVS